MKYPDEPISGDPHDEPPTARGPVAPESRNYADFLTVVANEDVRALHAKDKEYGGSWKKRGGVGAFMMLARKWDRLEARLQSAGFAHGKYDIFGAAEADTRPEGIIDDIRDLRRYLMLVEAELHARGVIVQLTS